MSSKRTRKSLRTLTMEVMEARIVLSGFDHGVLGMDFLIPPIKNPSPTVQADLDQIKADQDKLQTDSQSLAPTLQADRDAINLAMKSSTPIRAAQAAQATDQTNWENTQKADLAAIQNAADDTARLAAITQFLADKQVAEKTLNADEQSVEKAISTDPDVLAAKTKLQTDGQAIGDDQAALETDYLKLRLDLMAGSNPSAAVTADIAKIVTDQQKLRADSTSLHATLDTDRQAIQAAIAASTSIQAAKQTLNADQTSWLATQQKDWASIRNAADSATRQTAMAQYQTDRMAAQKSLEADELAIQTAITNDPAVQAAKAKLQTDSQPITADQAALQADQTQLQKDLAGQNGIGPATGSDGVTSTGSTKPDCPTTSSSSSSSSSSTYSSTESGKKVSLVTKATGKAAKTSAAKSHPVAARHLKTTSKHKF